MVKRIRINIVELDNKSRKGTYIRIRLNNKTYYYKQREGITPQKTIAHYQKEFKRTKGSPKGIRQLKGKAAKKKGPKKAAIKPAKTVMEKKLRKGIISVDLNTSTTPKELRTLMSKIVAKSVKNKKLRESITTEHNMRKVAKRFEHKIVLINEQGQIMTTLTRTGITPHQALREAKKEFEVGQYLEKSPGMRDMNGKGWNGVLEHEGTIAKISIKTTFRKRG